MAKTFLYLTIIDWEAYKLLLQTPLAMKAPIKEGLNQKKIKLIEILKSYFLR